MTVRKKACICIPSYSIVSAGMEAPAASMKMQIQDLKKVARSPEGADFVIYQDINLAVEEQAFVTVVGPSGCGKTTLLRTLHGLIKPTSGKIFLGGKVIEGPGLDRAMVFQSPRLLPWRTTLRNVTFGLELQKAPLKQAQDRAKELLERIGLEKFANYYPHQLSGGMQQRVNIARALAIDPEVLLMDEPFGALDAQTREAMQIELLRIWSYYKKTVVLVTHQIDEAIFLADLVVVMSGSPGRLKEKIPVVLPRPRTLEMKRTPEFVALEDHIWRSIQEEFQKKPVSLSAG